MYQDHFTQTVVTILAIVIGCIMAFAACFVDHLSLNYGTIYKLWGMITLTVLLVSSFVPYKKWSKNLLDALSVKEGTLWYKLLDNIVPTICLNTFITVMVSGANILFNESIPGADRMNEWIHTMLHDWPITFVISYFAAFAAEYCGVFVAKRNSKKAIHIS